MDKKVWFVTGSSSGFGYEICREVLKKGDYVIASARNIDGLLDRFGAISEDQLLLVSLDVTNVDSIAAAVEKGLDWKGRVDVLVNNAGIGSFGAMEEISLEQTRKVFEVNVFGLVAVTQAFLPHFRKRGSGTIVNISSVVGHATRPGFGAYAGSKHAVEALSESLYEEMKPLGVRVLIVEPGGFKTEFGEGNLLRGSTIEAYIDPLSETKMFLDNFKEFARGDPKKAASVIVGMVDLEDDTRRLPLGNDCMDWLSSRFDELALEVSRNEELSRSTDASN